MNLWIKCRMVTTVYKVLHCMHFDTYTHMYRHLDRSTDMYKTIKEDAPEYLSSSFTFASDCHARLLHASSNFQIV